MAFYIQEEKLWATMNIMIRRYLWFALILLPACTTVNENDAVHPPTVAPRESSAFRSVDPTATEETSKEIKRNRRVQVEGTFSPLYSLGFDAIRPIYDPAFIAAAVAPLGDNELILGVAWEGKAKAYPISVLHFREMVNDELAGIPTLVTW